MKATLRQTFRHVVEMTNQEAAMLQSALDSHITFLQRNLGPDSRALSEYRELHAAFEKMIVRPKRDFGQFTRHFVRE